MAVIVEEEDVEEEEEDGFPAAILTYEFTFCQGGCIFFFSLF